jgi:hypothetical protein
MEPLATKYPSVESANTRRDRLELVALLAGAELRDVQQAVTNPTA